VFSTCLSSMTPYRIPTNCGSRSSARDTYALGTPAHVLHHVSTQWLKHGAVEGCTRGRFFVDTEETSSHRIRRIHWQHANRAVVEPRATPGRRRRGLFRSSVSCVNDRVGGEASILARALMARTEGGQKRVRRKCL